MIYEIQKTTLPNSNEITFILGTKDDGVVLVIPCDEGNSDYQTYLAWLENPQGQQSTPEVPLA
jgi:hypothetical protein